MEQYVGLDVSLKQTAICIVDGAGKIQREGIVHSDPEAIAAFIRSNAPHVARIGLETGATSTWLWTELKNLGLPVICIDARHAKAALKMQINKSDRNDAVGIARIMQCGWYKEVRVKDLDSHAVKAVLVSRALLVKIKRDLENQIRGLLKNLGLVIGAAKMNVFALRAVELTEDRPELAVAVTPLLTARADKMLRGYLYEAANVLLTRVAKWSALKAWGIRLAKRSGLRKAKVAVARKLAVILHRMWIDGTEFKWSSKETANQTA
jgi:transposase